jgi:mannose-1-phosphate guanylyltransferase
MARMRALLLAAGVGSRLRPLTDVLPKCLMPIVDRPLLGYWLKMLCAAGVENIILNLHHHADLVREYVERSPHAALVTLSFESDLLGTGGTLLRHKDRFADAPLLLAHADNLSSFELAHFADAHRMRPQNAVLTMMTFITDAPQQCGIVEIDARGLVVDIHEKSARPPGNLANAAVYIVEPEVTAFLEGLGKPVIDFSTEVLPHFLGRISTFHNDCYHRDIGTLESLARAQLEYPLVTANMGKHPERDESWHYLLQMRNNYLAHTFGNAIRIAYQSPGPS